MPIIEMHLMEGRTSEQKQQMAEAVTAAIVDSLGVRPQAVRIVINEIKNDEFYVGGVRIPSVDATESNTTPLAGGSAL